MKRTNRDDFVELEQEPFMVDGIALWLYDKILVPPQCHLKLEFLSVNAQRRQGVRLGDMLKRKADLRLTVNGYTAPGFVLWADSCPPEVEITVAAPQERLFVYNIWDTGNGQYGSQVHGAGMLIEREQSEKRTLYRCTDASSAGFAETLVFSIIIR